MKRPYIFYFTRYTRSNGIRVMMLLSEKLAEAGFEVVYHVPEDNNALFRVCRSNPNVARLVLFYPGRNGGMKKYHHSEMVFAYRPEFLPGADVLTIPWIDRKLFNDPGFERTADCCFVYKGGRWTDRPELRGLKTITMDWPESREALADLLKRTRTLYSFDSASAVLNEAAACGAHVMLVTENGYEEFRDDHAEVESAFPAQFANFVERTQKSDYRGRMQSRFLFAYWTYAVWRYWIKPRLARTK